MIVFLYFSCSSSVCVVFGVKIVQNSTISICYICQRLFSVEIYDGTTVDTISPTFHFNEVKDRSLITTQKFIFYYIYFDRKIFEYFYVLLMFTGFGVRFFKNRKIHNLRIIKVFPRLSP